MAEPANPFEAVRAMMLENLERVQSATQSYIDTVEKAMQGFPGANQEQITTFKAYVERKLKQTVISWKSFCVQRIFKKLSAFKSNTFSLN